MPKYQYIGWLCCLLAMIPGMAPGMVPGMAAGMAADSDADDTELFVYPFSQSGDIRPKVLIIFDNSGSMGETMATLYSANYIRGYDGPTANRIQSRLQIAKDAVKGLISSMPGVDFGLTAAINTNSSLSATLYEGYRFFGGQSLIFGADYPWRIPPADSLVEGPLGTYRAPYDKGSNNGYIIYISDGEPSQDAAADGLVQRLLATLSRAERLAYGSTVGYGSRGQRSYLAALAGYMKNKDVNRAAPGVQTVTTFTVGFGDDAVSGAGKLLAETARRGGGSYYPATDARALTEALNAAVRAILPSNTTLVPPAIAASKLDRTRSLPNLYYAMFAADAGPRWQGNLKKLVFSDNGYVADLNGLPAINSDGTIIESAQTYWSAERDGNDVAKGGAQAMLAEKAERALYVIDGPQARLVPLDRANVERIAGSRAALLAHLQVADSAEADQLIGWARGRDVDNEDLDEVTVRRRFILGDPLHARPLVINYGPPSAGENDGADVRILLGTNGGFLHMFKDAGRTIDESWAVIPYEFLANQQALRNNRASSRHLYGVDSSAMAIIKDTNNNGVIKASEHDLAWLFVGLGGGGRRYYGFDISDPDLPVFKWSFSSQSRGAGLLGLTWSVPQAAVVPGMTDPVLIFAGGYDLNKSRAGLGRPDSSGAGIYMVNANSGALIFSATPAPHSAINLSVPAMTDSMPGSVALLDSNGDGNTDRIYAGDTGGNIWRMDLPSADRADWSVFKFASLGSDTVPGADRRFFTQPVLVRTINQEITRTRVNGTEQYRYSSRPFDAVLIGSGDRNRPLSETRVKNGYFMLRDVNVAAKSYRVDPPRPLLITDLYDVTIDPLAGKSSASEILNIKATISSKKGWVYWLNEPGEKSLGSGLVLRGKLYFTSFLPPLPSLQTASIPSIGTMRQYMIDMYYGTSLDNREDQDANKLPLRYTQVNNKLAADLVVLGGNNGKVYIIGGAPGAGVILENKGEGQPERCTRPGVCAQGAEEVEMAMSADKIYLYEGSQ